MQGRAKTLRLKLAKVLPFLNEKQRRVPAASEAKSYSRGGVTVVTRVTGMCRQTIYNGLTDLADDNSSQKIRKPGGGRKKLRDLNPGLVEEIEDLIDDVTRGDPESPLRWTCKSVKKVEKSLKKTGYSISYRTVARILHEQEYSLQANRKTSEGKKDHPDRDQQFRYINEQAKEFLRAGDPVISVDTKKKELAQLPQF
jgi:transposase